MAITSEQQSDILKVVAGLFNAAPGGSNLTDLAEIVNAGTSVQNLSDLLATNALFTNDVMAGKVTTTDQAAVIAANFGLTADTDSASAGSQAQAFFEGQIDAGVGFGAIVYQAVTFLSGTVPAEFTETKTLLENKVLVSQAFSSTSSSSSLSELQNVLSNVTGTAPFTQADVDAALAGSGSGTGTGETFTLTAATDNVTGSSGNDVIIGDLTGTATINASDQINGGGGTDTFKIFGAFTAGTSATGVMTNVEVLEIANVANAAQVFTSVTKAGQGVEMIEIGNASLLNGQTITTTTGQTLSLSTGTAGVATAGTVTWAGPAADTALNLYLNGYQGGTGVTVAAVTVTGALATTLNIKSMGATNATAAFTGPTSVLNHVITGDQKFTYALAAADAAALNGVDASGNTGGTNVNTTAGTTKAAFTFAGGAGTDSLTMANNNLGVLTAGSQLDGGAGSQDKLGIFDTALTAAETTAINAVQNFEVLGLNAALTLDGSSLTSVQSFAIDTAALTNVITNMATGANVALNVASTAQTYSGAVGVNDLSVDIGSGTNAAIVSTALTLGQTVVALSSNGAQGVTNTITTLNNADNSVYTITGSAGLTITNATDATSTGTKFDGSGMTGALTMIGNTTAFAAGSGLGDIIIGGSGADNITSSINGATMTGNAGNDTFNVSVALGGIAATALLPTVTDFTKGDILTFGGTAGAFTAGAVDLSGAANVAAALNLLAAGSNSDLKWGTFGGNTYIVDDVDAGATFAATDTGVVLSGVLDLSTSTLTGANLTFA